MSIVYEPHACATPSANTNGNPRIPRFEKGTLWQCDECGKVWRYREKFIEWIGEWRRVRFWNLVAKSRIGKDDE